MVFSSLMFMCIFLPIVLIAYNLSKNLTYKNTVLIIASLFFYAWGEPISKSGSMVATLGTENLFRYREYVYDEETKLYYNKECGIDGEKSLNEVKGELK